MIRERTGDQVPVTVIAVSAEVFPVRKRVRIPVEPRRRRNSIRVGKRNIAAQHGKLPFPRFPQHGQIVLSKKVARMAIRHRVPDLVHTRSDKGYGVRGNAE